MASFSVKERKRVSQRQPKEHDAKLAASFVQGVRKELGAFLKASVLFGSCATGHGSPVSDIDVLLVIDDLGRVITPEVTEAYRLIVDKTAKRVSPRLHINTLKLSNFWEYCREGDPVIVNMLRDGVILHDDGFFAPAQLLLDQGRIRPTREAIWTYYARTGTTLRNARQHVLQACVDLYWAAIDASHAALMAVGEVPPSPEHVADLLNSVLVKRKLLDPKYPRVMRELYSLQKGITHREIREVTGEHYDLYLKETLRLVEALRTIVERHPGP